MNSPSVTRASKTNSLHSGKWTHEESDYVKELIKEFEAGSLNIEENISLRSFLSKALNCSPKRISKKFEGTSYNGKQLYKRKTSSLAPDEVQVRREKLRELERKYQESLRVLKLVEASRKSSCAQGQSNSLDINDSLRSPLGAAVGEPTLQTAYGLVLANFTREARIARLKAELAMVAALRFNPSSSSVVAPGRSSLGLLEGPARLPPLPRAPSPPRANQPSIQEDLVLGEIMVAGSSVSLPAGIAPLRGHADLVEQQLKRGLFFSQTDAGLPAWKRFRLS